MTLFSASIKTSVLLSLCSLFLTAQDTSTTLFRFEQDIRVFTAQAFQNAAGYDHEWRKAGMHPLGTEIRAELFSTLDSSYVTKLHTFLKSCDWDWSSCASYALLTSGPPDFRLSYDQKTTPYAERTIHDMPGLSPVLAEFYVKANVPALWRKYGPQFQELNDKFRPHASQALDDITRYCRLEKDYFLHKASHMHVIFAPLQSYFTAFTNEVGDEIYLVFGPQPSEPSPSSFYHEALHHVLSPLTQKLDTSLTDRFKELYALATSRGHVGYGHIDEAFVRTIGCVLEGRLFSEPDSTVLANVTNEYKLGFILCLPIYEQLKQYEASKLTFAQFFPRILTSIDVEREKLRWHDLTKNAKWVLLVTATTSPNKRQTGARTLNRRR
jgi:hypothetical protein